MCKNENRFFSAVVRLFDAIRQHDAVWAFGAMLSGCAVLLSGCVKDDHPFGEPNKATVQLSVEANTVEETGGELSEAEGKLHTLRVYAFADGRPVGHYFTDNVTVTDGRHTFYMDLTFHSAGVQHTYFYVVANEEAMTLRLSPTATEQSYLSERTGEAELKNLWFNNYLWGNLETKGLPMYFMTEPDKPIALDFSNLKTETAPAGSGHEGHALLNGTIAFQLARPVGKIGVFVAKGDGETGTLRVTGLTFLKEGTLVRNYIMPQNDETLKAVLGGEIDLPVAVVEGDVTATIAANAPSDIRTNPASYTPVMAAPYYPYENPWSNGGDWSVPGNAERHGHALQIKYQFDGEAERTRIVYLPRILRNHYYAICCLIHNDGLITVTYSVADWSAPTGDIYNENGEYEIEFNYPQYKNPLRPENGIALEQGQKYPQPTIWFNPTSDEGSYTFRFDITGPLGQKWSPVRDQGTAADDLEIKVYQKAADGVTKEWKDFEGNTETTLDDCVASAEPYYIVVKARKAANVNKEYRLGISYDRSWHTSGSSLLLINGLTHALSWEGTEVAEYIVIKQIDVPEGQSIDDPAGENNHEP